MGDVMNQKRIIISHTPEETCLALTDGGELTYFEASRPRQVTLVGNIYLGKVQNSRPGLEAVFVDIGESKNAFLYVGDIEPTKKQNITVGQKIPLQIIKDAFGTKGPRATTRISLPGRYLVLLPENNGGAGISRRITDEKEITRLRELGEEFCAKGAGVIFRTVAQGATEEVLIEDFARLSDIYAHIMKRAKELNAPALLYGDENFLRRAVRDFFTDEVDELIVDEAAAFDEAQAAAKADAPDLLPRIKLYRDDEPIFRAFALEEQIASLTARIVKLKSGGYIVIDKTEALTVIDVNTGASAGRHNLSETAYQTNREAAAEIIRQLNLRDIGGIIIVDFIDMNREEQKNALLAYLSEMVKFDRAKTNIVGITALGLVEITRRKMRQNLDSLIYEECPCCNGSGKILSLQTLVIRLSRELRRLERKHHAADGYDIELNPRTLGRLQKGERLNRLAAELGITLNLIDAPNLPFDQYTILTPAN